MKKLFSICVLFFSIAINAQEICNNGIDDDGDNLIDLNDSVNCVCGPGTPSVVPSLIPNPSFEQHTCCPQSFSELNCATGWEQATVATSDYFNACGYVASGITNAGLGTFPDGVASAGVIIGADYKEYLGACLISPMVAGTAYKINFNIASFMAGSVLDDCSSGVNNPFGPLDITIFGNPNCPTFPVGSANDCPTIMDPSWTVLGTVNYTPSATWGLASISFTPSYNVNAMILGSPCNLPSAYPSIVSANCYPYFLFDNLTLNNAASFGLVSISSTGHYCTDNIVLSANLSGSVTMGATYQWYHNGVAIVGSTGLNYSVTPGSTGLGDYQVMLNDGSLCALSSIYNVNTNPPTISVTSTTICPASQAVLTATSTVINTYTWSTGATTNTISVNPAGTTTYTVSSIFGNCTALSVSTVVVTSDLLDIIVDNPVICPTESAIISTTISPNYLLSTTNYTWSTGSNSDNITVNPSATTIYTVYAAAGTCTAIATSTVTVLTPGSLSISGNTLVCAGQSTTLTPNLAFDFVVWDDGGTNTLNNLFTPTVIATPNTTTTYTLTGYTGFSFCSETAVITISVLPSPNISIFPNSSSVCAGTAVNLSALGSTNGYTWSTGATNTSSITVTPTVSTTYSVTGSNGTCPATATAVVNMASTPVVTVNSATICFGQATTLTALGAFSYTWNTGSNSSSPSFSPSVTTTYTVVGSNGSTGCAALPKTATVTVINVMADFNTSQKTLPVNSTLDLTNASSNAVNYTWLLCNNTTTNTTNASVALKDTGICCIQLIAYHSPCSDTAIKCVLVTPESMIDIPNVFTPNGDNKNEVFKINSIGLKSLHCIIYNRWGTKMYEWDGTTGFWDGKTKTGTAADGTYFYIVNYTDAQDNKKEEKGFISLFSN